MNLADKIKVTNHVTLKMERLSEIVCGPIWALKIRTGRHKCQ